jgi:hypothetical protein
VLAVHVSNKHLDLAPVVDVAARSLGKHAMLIDTDDDDDNAVFAASWVVVSARQSYFEFPLIMKAAAPITGGTHLRMWTDDYSNLFQIVKWK